MDALEFLPRYLPGRVSNPAYMKRYRQQNIERITAHRKRRRELYPEEHKATNRRRYQILRAWRDGYKLMVGCMDCGYRQHASVLEYDHRPGTIKRFAIGQYRGEPLRMWFEIQKCDVVCANCHRVRTLERRCQTP